MSEHGKRGERDRINPAVTLEEVGQRLTECMAYVDDPSQGAQDCLSDLIKDMHQRFYPDAWENYLHSLKEFAEPIFIEGSFDLLANTEVDLLSVGEIITAASYEISETHSLTCDHLKAARALLDQCVSRVPEIHRMLNA